MQPTNVAPPPPPLPPLPPRPPATTGPPPGHHERSRPGRVLVLLAGGLATVLLIGLGTYQVAATLAHEEHTEPVAFAGEIRHIVVDVGTGSITIRGGERPDVHGVRHLSRGLRTPTLRERIEGDTLHLQGDCPGFANVWCRVSYDLDVPRGVTVAATSGPGDIDVVGVDGDVSARTIVGDVHVADVGGAVEMESAAGSIDGERLRSEKVTASTSAGDVSLQFSHTPGAVSARSAAGDVDIELPRTDVVYRVDATTAAGERVVMVNTSLQSDRFIVATSAAGAVKVHYPA